MAGVVPPPEANGATIIFHCTADDTVLVGEEGNWLVEDNSPHYFAGDEDIVTTCLDPTGKTREQLTIEAIPRIRQQIINLIDDGSKPKKNLLPNVKAKLSNFNEIVYPIVTRDSRNNCAKPVAGGPVLQRFFSYVTKRKSDPTKRSLGFPKGGRKKDRTTKQYTESVVECAQRELYEEIGNIGAGGESILPGGGISIDNADFVDYDGKGSEKYAIYYKRITDVEKHLIEHVIDRRRNLLIGETFDVRFIPRSQLDKIKLNDKSKLAKGFIQAPPPAPAPVPPSPPLVLPAGATIPKTKSERDNARRAINLQARGKLVPPHLRKYLGTGGAKKTRRRITRKRRTTSKRR
jgi:8-oxo-dGTP pyrophosphatase MutT (NUDIX family)